MGDISKSLRTWAELNTALRTADERTCRALMRHELKHKRRRQFVMRIHSRLNRIRALTERDDLKKQLG